MPRMRNLEQLMSLYEAVFRYGGDLTEHEMHIRYYAQDKDLEVCQRDFWELNDEMRDEEGEIVEAALQATLGRLREAAGVLTRSELREGTTEQIEICLTALNALNKGGVEAHTTLGKAAYHLSRALEVLEAEKGKKIANG